MASRLGHLRENVLRTFPTRKAQLPTDADALHFQKTKQQWVTELRGLDPRSARAQENAAVDVLGEMLRGE